VVTEYSITGRLARFGRGGMIEDISERLLRQFAQCLQESLGATPVVQEIEGAQLAASVLRTRAFRHRRAIGSALLGLALLVLLRARARRSREREI
jgi:hypothetical protein